MKYAFSFNVKSDPMILYIKCVAHWLWIKFLIACGSPRMAAYPIRTLAMLRWLLFFQKRTRIEQNFQSLAAIAKAAGRSGKLTTVSPRQLTREYFYQRTFLGVVPALSATAPPAYAKALAGHTAFEHVVATAAAGNGLLFAGTHYGSMGFLTARLARAGNHVIVLRAGQFEPIMRTPHAKQFFAGAHPLFLHYDDPKTMDVALIHCARAMRKGAVIGYTVDANNGSRSRQHTIFGRPIIIRTALLELAMRLQVPVISGFGYGVNNKISTCLQDPTVLRTEAELDSWCTIFCRNWEQTLLNHPEAMAWHTNDLQLLKKNPQ